jgi:MFS family permease
MNDNSRNALAAFLLIGVSVTTAITAIRQYSTAYMMVEPSREYALIASFMVVGALILAILFPASSRFGFPVLAGSVVVAIAVAIAPKLGLIEHAPLAWRWALMGAVAFPIGVVVSQLRGFAFGAKVSESQRKLPKATRKSLSIRRPAKALSGGKRPKELANPDSESPNASAEEITTWLETLTVFVDKKGNRAEAARALDMTPPGVSYHLRQLYKVEPDLMEEKVPEWVQRNIKE